MFNYWEFLGKPIPQEYVSPQERQRQERIAVGRICKCGTCICCYEWAADQKRILTLLKSKRTTESYS